MGNPIYCRACGKEIFFIRTKSDKYIPCEPVPEHYIPDDDGRTRYYQRSGSSERGHFDYTEGQAIGGRTGYLPHWSRCSEVEALRSSRAKQKESAAAIEALRLKIAKEREIEAIKKKKADRKAEEEHARREVAAAQMRLF